MGTQTSLRPTRRVTRLPPTQTTIMPSFAFTAREAGSGRELRNTIDAPTEQDAVKALLDRNLLVTSITEATAKKGKAQSGTVPLSDLVMFTRQLATLIDAGISIVQSLQTLAEQTTNKVMRDLIRDVTSRVESGDNFSQALHRHPKVFSRMYVSMVDAGEKGGLLQEILSRLATYQENTARLHKKVKSAMMYPTIVTLVAVTITIFLIVKVVPVFGEIYDGFDAELPGPTQFLIAVSDWMKAWWFMIIVGLVIAGWGWLKFIDTPKGREFWDRIRIQLPVFGGIAHKICLARFARTLSSLVRSGVPLLEVLNIVANTCGHTGMEKSIRVASDDIEKGDGIATALGKHPIFPLMIVRMLSAGEQTGRIDSMLEKVADTLDEEIDTILSGLTSLIEPLLIVFLGVTIGGIVICMFMPIFKMSEIINQ
jgi:type IV pilus assembly protein PilC